jgi:hypothetical protein
MVFRATSGLLIMSKLDMLKTIGISAARGVGYHRILQAAL